MVESKDLLSIFRGKSAANESPNLLSGSGRAKKEKVSFTTVASLVSSLLTEL